MADLHTAAAIGTQKSPASRAALNGKRLRIGRAILLPALFIISVLIVWEVACIALAIRPVDLPAPSMVLRYLMSAWPQLRIHAIPTTLEALGGFTIACVGGIALATALAYSQTLRETVYPSIVFFQLIPKIALAPLFIAWLGIGSASRLSITVFVCFFPVVLATLAGLQQTPPDMLRLCRAFTASPWQSFIHVRFPFAMPFIFNGMKIAMTFAIIGVIVGEFITAQRGLGYIILFAAGQAETPLVFAALVVLCLVGLALFGMVAIAERFVQRIFGR